MRIKIYDCIQGTPEWHELRLGKITGTSVKTLLTKNKQEALNKQDTGTFKGNYHTERGHTLEESAVQLYEDINNLKILRAGFVTNSKYKGCGYSPDGLLPDKLIEVKCFAEQRHKLASSTIPFEILAQIHFGMMICDLPETDLLFYNPDLEIKDCLIIRNIKRDKRIENNIVRRLVGDHGKTDLG